MKSSAKEHLNDLSKRYPALMCCAAEVEAAAQQMIACYQNGESFWFAATEAALQTVCILWAN